MVSKTAIILAGGVGRRFQGSARSLQERGWKDKGLVEINHVPAIIQILQRVVHLVDETILVTDTKSRKERYLRLLQKYRFKNNIFIDDKGEDKSPLLGVKTGLKYAKGEYCFVLPCDAPFPSSKVIELLFTKAKGFDCAIPIWANGWLEPLFAVYRRKSTSCFADLLYRIGRRRPDDLIRASSNNHFIPIHEEIAPLDPFFSSFININYPGDLTAPITKKASPGPIKKSFSLSSPSLSLVTIKKIENELNIREREDSFTQARALQLISKKLSRKEVFYWAAIISEQSYKSLLRYTINSFYLRKNPSILAQMSESLVNANRFYEKEAEKYIEKNVIHLFSHAEKDIQLCKQELTILKRRLL